eukprot:1186687-Prorocentrum_minimum.AAC.1
MWLTSDRTWSSQGCRQSWVAQLASRRRAVSRLGTRGGSAAAVASAPLSAAPPLVAACLATPALSTSTRAKSMAAEKRAKAPASVSDE